MTSSPPISKLAPSTTLPPLPKPPDDSIGSLPKADVPRRNENRSVRYLEWVDRNRDRLRQVGMSQSFTMGQGSVVPNAPALDAQLLAAQVVMNKKDEDLELSEIEVLLAPCDR